MNKYRFDNRSEDEFKKDIKDSTMMERSLFFMWLDLVEKETGSRPKFTDTGCGNDGEFLEDKKVTTDPDFTVDGYGEVEVKFSKPMITTNFHLKANQMKSYCKRNATILMVNGSGEEIPVFTLLKPEALEAIVEECKCINFKGFGWKQAYRIPVKRFLWRPLVHSNS